MVVHIVISVALAITKLTTCQEFVLKSDCIQFVLERIGRRMADKIVNDLTNTFSNMFRNNGIAGQEMLSQDETKLDGFVDDTDTNRSRSDSVASNDSGIGDCEVDVDPETGLEVFSLDEVSYHCTMEDGRMVIFDKVMCQSTWREAGTLVVRM